MTERKFVRAIAAMWTAIVLVAGTGAVAIVLILHRNASVAVVPTEEPPATPAAPAVTSAQPVTFPTPAETEDQPPPSAEDRRSKSQEEVLDQLARWWIAQGAQAASLRKIQRVGQIGQLPPMLIWHVIDDENVIVRFAGENIERLWVMTDARGLVDGRRIGFPRSCVVVGTVDYAGTRMFQVVELADEVEQRLWKRVNEIRMGRPKPESDQKGLDNGEELRQ